jgi:hypothetical protein
MWFAASAGMPYATRPTDRRDCRMNIVGINFEYLNANLV